MRTATALVTADQVGELKPELNGHQLEEVTDDDLTPQANGQRTYDTITSQLSLLTHEQLEELSSSVVARICLRRQEENLASFVEKFTDLADSDFKATQPKLMQSFLKLVEGMRIKITEQPLESTSSREGTITISVPGLPEGVTVTRSRDTFFVNEDKTLLERNEVRVRLAGLDIYSGYWLAVDAPANGIEDPLQEEGIDTLKRVMEAVGILITDEVYEDALEYPFLSILLAPFGPEAVLPFEEHLRSLHRESTQKHGGCWYRMSSPRKDRSTLEQVTEGDDEAFEEGTEIAEEGEEEEVQPNLVTRRGLTAAEEADLELDKLDL